MDASYEKVKEQFAQRYAKGDPNRVNHFKIGLTAARNEELPLTYPSTNMPEYRDGYEYGQYTQQEEGNQ